MGERRSQRGWVVSLALLLVMMLAAPATAQDDAEQSPAPPNDDAPQWDALDSPRETMFTFLEAANELLLGRDDVHGLVPLTRDRTVLDLYAAHASSQSVPEQGLWRAAWLNLDAFPTIPVVHAGSDVSGHTSATTTDGDDAMATITDDPGTSGTQYTIVTVPDDNADFLGNDARPGDILRTNFVTDGFGNTTYDEFVVDLVQADNQLRLVSGPSSEVSVAQKIEIWRSLNATEESAEIAKDAGSWANPLVRAVWPDQIESSGTVQEGFHVCAALAGLASGVLPHQGLTNLEISGFSDVPRTTDKFNRPQLDAMAAAGVWIVTQDRFNGEVFSRHAVTTGNSDDINEREEMIRRNADSISFRFKDHFQPFIGVSNVTSSMVSVLDREVRQLVEVLKTESVTERLGGQIEDATILRLSPHATLKDRIVLELDVEAPAPFNNFEVHLVL